ncbi:MAG: hypothetical protein J6A84_00850 [Clostridia bacterium]|nr:hypothetical protein [Clostridia bacterium]
MKKKLLIVVSLVLAVAAIVTASVMGTIAYMTSASKVSNVFTVGDVYITLDESAVNPNGTLVENGGRTDRNSYHLMPGETYIKDPAITVRADTEVCYLFLVTRNQITAIEANANGEQTGKPTMAEQMYENGWAIYKDTTVGSRVWVYCGTKDNINGRYDAENPTNQYYTPKAVCGASVTPSDTSKIFQASADPAMRIPIFSNFSITADSEISIKPYSGAEVTINAVAIQASSEFGGLCSHEAIDNAWAAVIAQYPYIQD